MIQFARHIQPARPVAADIPVCRRAGLRSPADYAHASHDAFDESFDSVFTASHPGGRDARPPRRAGMPTATNAFSLIEVLIAVTLMSVIVLGLMAMFGETQRAFRTGINQVDIMEGGRSAMDLIAREVEQATATDEPLAPNFVVGQNPFVGAPSLGFSPPALQPYMLLQELPGTAEQRTNVLQDIAFMSREGQQWRATGYAVVYSNYVGTLYRYQTNFSAVQPGWQYALYDAYNTFYGANPNAAAPSHLLDNVVHLRFRTYDSLGRLLSRDWNYKSVSAQVINYPPPLAPRLDDTPVEFYSNALPAYVEIELGVLDAKAAGRARAAGEDSLSAQRLYLEKQAGSVQIFRRRVPIRNVDPSVYQ